MGVTPAVTEDSCLVRRGSVGSRYTTLGPSRLRFIRSFVYACGKAYYSFPVLPFTSFASIFISPLYFIQPALNEATVPRD